MKDDTDVEIGAWIKIDDTSRIDYDVYPDGQVEFCLGGNDRFVLVTTELGLQNLITHAGQALQEVRESITSE
ncbi:MAG: hypothetical protein ACRDTF_17165 [Pseudonocardiaceae bacterium]